MSEEYTPTKLAKDTPEPKEFGAYLISLDSKPYILVHKLGSPVDSYWKDEEFEDSSWQEIAVRFDLDETATIQSLAAHDHEVAAKALIITNNDIDPHTASKRIVEAGNWLGDGYWSLGDLNNLLIGIAEQRYGERK